MSVCVYVCVCVCMCVYVCVCGGGEGYNVTTECSQCNFTREFLTSVMKICTKMWELRAHQDHYHLYIPLTSKKGKFQPQTNIFLGITTLFLSNLALLCWSKKNINFRVLKFLHLFQRGKIMVSKYGNRNTYLLLLDPVLCIVLIC